jgi:hypothetical protein
MNGAIVMDVVMVSEEIGELAGIYEWSLVMSAELFASTIRL